MTDHWDSGLFTKHPPHQHPIDLWIANWYPEFGKPGREWTLYENLRWWGSGALIGLFVGHFYWFPYNTPWWAAVPVLIGFIWMWWPRDKQS